MEQKIKFILVGLIGISVIFGLLYFQTLTAKQKIINEKNALGEQNSALNTKLAQLESNIQQSSSKINLLNKELDRISKEKADIEKKYEIANKEKQDLTAKLKAQQEKAAQAQQAPDAQKEEAKPAGTDEYWAGVLKEKTDLALQLNNIRSELKSMQIKNEEVMREKSNLDMDLKNITNEKEDLARKFEYNKKLLDSISKELVVEKNDKMRLQDNFKALKSENSLLTRQVKNLDSRKMTLERKLQELGEENAAMKDRLGHLESGIAARISEFKQQLENIQSTRVDIETLETAAPQRESSVELPPIVVRPQSPSLTHSPQSNVMLGESKVLSVNKENNFVIIDKGAEDGIKVGQLFSVERGGKEIAELQVIQARDNIAACDIKRQTTPIKAGDIVR